MQFSTITHVDNYLSASDDVLFCAKWQGCNLQIERRLFDIMRKKYEKPKRGSVYDYTANKLQNTPKRRQL